MEAEGGMHRRTHERLPSQVQRVDIAATEHFAGGAVSFPEFGVYRGQLLSGRSWRMRLLAHLRSQTSFSHFELPSCHDLFEAARAGSGSTRADGGGPALSRLQYRPGWTQAPPCLAGSSVRIVRTSVITRRGSRKPTL
jgi:hypothetical protein